MGQVRTHSEQVFSLEASLFIYNDELLESLQMRHSCSDLSLCGIIIMCSLQLLFAHYLGEGGAFLPLEKVKSGSTLLQNFSCHGLRVRLSLRFVWGSFVGTSSA